MNYFILQTSIITRYTQDQFAKQYEQTVGIDFFLKRIVLPGRYMLLYFASSHMARSYCLLVLCRWKACDYPTLGCWWANIGWKHVGQICLWSSGMLTFITFCVNCDCAGLNAPLITQLFW